MIKDLIQRLAPQLQTYALKFDIPQFILETDPFLVELILTSKAIDTDSEKQEWFDLLEIMNEEQIKKLKDILIREREKLLEIEEKYNKKRIEIKNKYLERWQKLQYNKKIEEIKNKEKEENEDPDKLLDML